MRMAFRADRDGDGAGARPGGGVRAAPPEGASATAGDRRGPRSPAAAPRLRRPAPPRRRPDHPGRVQRGRRRRARGLVGRRASALHLLRAAAGPARRRPARRRDLSRRLRAARGRGRPRRVDPLRAELESSARRSTRALDRSQPRARSDVRSVGQGLAIAFEPPAETADRTRSRRRRLPAAPAAAAASAGRGGGRSRGRPRATRQARARPLARGGRVAADSRGRRHGALCSATASSPPRTSCWRTRRGSSSICPGVKNEVRRRVVPVKSALVSRVRVSQFQSLPSP